MAEASDTYQLIVETGMEGPYTAEDLRDLLRRGKARAADRVVHVQTKSSCLVSQVIPDADELMKSVPSASDRIRRKTSDRQQAVAEANQRKTSQRLVAITEPVRDGRRPSEVLPAIAEAVKAQNGTSDRPSAGSQAEQDRRRRTSERLAAETEKDRQRRTSERLTAVQDNGNLLRRTSEHLQAITEASKEVARNNPVTMAIATLVIILSGIAIWFELGPEGPVQKPFVGTSWAAVDKDHKSPLGDLHLTFADTTVTISSGGKSLACGYHLDLSQPGKCVFTLDQSHPAIGAGFTYDVTTPDPMFIAGNGQKVILDRVVATP